MTEVNDIYKPQSGIDNSLLAMEDRLISLQPSLTSLMGQALDLFGNVYPQAPHPSTVEGPLVVYGTETMNICPVEGIPMVRELTVVLGASRWVRIFSTTKGAPNDYPRERLWFMRPEGDVSRKVNIIRSHHPSNSDFPYSIETADYRDGSCLGFVGGAPYYAQEPFIDETVSALDEAKQIAQDNGYFL